MTTHLMNRPVPSLIVRPADAPMTIDYARRHIKALMGSDDVMVANWIEAARAFFESQTGRQIVTATWEIWLDRFPLGNARIEIPKPPLQTVVSVSYIGSDGTLVSFDDGASPATASWQAKAPAGEFAGPGWIEPVYGAQWPFARVESGAVRIQFTAGYGDEMADVPPLILGALAYLVGNYDTQRVPVIDGRFAEAPYGVRAILDEFRYSAFPTTAYAKPWWPEASAWGY